MVFKFLKYIKTLRFFLTKRLVLLHKNLFATLREKLSQSSQRHHKVHKIKILETLCFSKLTFNYYTKNSANSVLNKIFASIA